MNLKTKTAFCIAIAVIVTFTACNPSKGNTADIPQSERPENQTTQIILIEADFDIEDGKIYGYNGMETSIVIPSIIQGQAVTEIAKWAFASRDRGITSLTIRDGVKSIGANAFSDNKLTSVTLPNSLTKIELCAFLNNELTSVTIPHSVTEIGGAAFNNNQLTSITIGANVKLGGLDSYGRGPLDTFDDFDVAYNDNGKQAGTYTLNNGVWTHRP